MKNEKITAKNWFEQLRSKIRDKFLSIEREFDAGFCGDFECQNWQREGGGGQISVMYGNVFEKVGVNVSTVYGQFSESFAKEIPGADKSCGDFWASGISLVAHMSSPMVPTIHMNTRMVITKNYWFGGGIDLTPTYYNADDDLFFHAKLKNVCDRHDVDYYPKFKKWADDYFFIKHRREPRGIGGIFYDYINTQNWDADFLFTQDVGESFLSIYPQIVKKSMKRSYAKEQKEFQLLKRGRYAEFNLVWDRGTRFGLMTAANPQAVLMSLPPCAKWENF